MKKYVNNRYVEMTDAEIKAAQAESAKAAAMERQHSMTAYEVISMLIPLLINTLAVDDNTALRMKDFYPQWASGVNYPAGCKVQYSSKLWQAVQAHTSQTSWNPESAPSLWETVNETHVGTLDDPIPYDGNMVLESGKHYLQEGEFYLCIRDSGVPVYHPLKELVNLYVTLI